MPHGFLRLVSTLAAPSPAVSATSRAAGRALRGGAHDLETASDGRRAEGRGPRGAHDTTHPARAGGARSGAAVYARQHEGAHQEPLTIPAQSTGRPVSRAYLQP